MSLRVTPASSHPSSTTNLSTRTLPTSTGPSNAPKGAPSAPGIHDTLRARTTLPTSDPTHQPLQSSHPLENRLARWQATQDALKMEGLRRTFGVAEPVRRGMELKICREGDWRPAMLGSGASASGMGVHEEILRGTDASVAWEDVFAGGEEFREAPDFHTEMEHRLKMNW